MSSTGGIARVLVVVLIAGLVALFAAMAIDMAVPAPQDPWASASSSTSALSTAQSAEFEQRRDEIDTRLAQKEITQTQADELTAQVGSDESDAWTVLNQEPDLAAQEAYNTAAERHGLVLGAVAALLVALMLAEGVFLTRRRRALGEVPLFAGAFLGIYGMGVSGLGSGVRWEGIAITASIAACSVAAGLLAFTPPAEEPIV